MTWVTDAHSAGLDIISLVFRLRQFAAALVLTVLVGAPAAACVIAASQMTPDEEECCRQMAGDCGKIIMPVAHSCCPAFKRDNSMSVALKVTKAAPVLVTVALPAIPALPPRLSLPAIAGHSPPESPPGANSILRI